MTAAVGRRETSDDGGATAATLQVAAQHVAHRVEPDHPAGLGDQVDRDIGAGEHADTPTRRTASARLVGHRDLPRERRVLRGAPSRPGGSPDAEPDPSRPDPTFPDSGGLRSAEIGRSSADPTRLAMSPMSTDWIVPPSSSINSRRASGLTIRGIAGFEALRSSVPSTGAGPVWSAGPLGAGALGASTAWSAGRCRGASTSESAGRCRLGASRPLDRGRRCLGGASTAGPDGRCPWDATTVTPRCFAMKAAVTGE